MSSANEPNDATADTGSAVTSDCPLTYKEQTRNIYLFAITNALIYLAAPVLYVGIVQAALCKTLKTTDAVANLPASIYLWVMPVPVLVAWYFPHVRFFKRLIALGFLGMGAGGAVVALALLLPTSQWVIGSLLIDAVVAGVANGVVWSLHWEILGRGVTESRRGQALALAYGAGPIFAVVGSLLSQLALTRIGYPWNFTLLFGLSAPIMALAAFLSSRFVMPRSSVEPTRQPFFAGVFGGLKEYLSYRLILIAGLAFILVYAGGNAIEPNVSLYAQASLGVSAEALPGYQSALRFGFKFLAGFFLGWLLTRTNAKFLMLATCGLSLVGVLWALLIPGKWYLLSFGFLGAGELFGAYFPNYIASCSAKSKMRRNMAYTNMLTLFAGFGPIMFGTISDRFGGSAHGLRVSFLVAIAILVATLLIVQFLLPARARPRECDMDEADKALERHAPRVDQG